MIRHTKYEHTQYSLSERENIFYNLKKHNQGIILHTCNRIELFEGKGWVNEEIVSHLFELTAGLKSRLLGESSIQGQVKQAYTEAIAQKTLDKNLHKLFQQALFVGKKVRTDTMISQGAMSHSQATVQILEKHFSKIDGLNVVLIGVHNLNELILEFLKKRGAKKLFISNRNFIKAARLAEKHNCSAFSFEKINEYIQQADVIISATSAPHYILKENQVSVNKNLLLFDLAVPRDIDPNLANHSGISLYNVENIEDAIEQNLSNRRNEISKVKDIVNKETELFMDWQFKQRNYEQNKTKSTFAA